MKTKIFSPVLMILCVLTFGQQGPSSPDGSKAEKRMTYYEDGSKKSEGTYKNGQLEGPFIEWYPNGSKSMEGQFKDGKYHGLWFYWYEDGKPRGKGEFKNGLRVGTHLFRHKTGAKFAEVPHKNGRFHGKYKEYNPEGKLLEEVEFNEGIRDGAFTWWHENGKIALQGQYKNNRRTGKWVSLDKQGKRFTERVYKDGKVTAEDNELNARSRANTRAAYEIMIPRDYSPAKKYPLVLVLHGGQGSILHEKMFWKADQLKELKNYIFVFLQSSQVFEMNCFNWNNIETARKDIKHLYKKIIIKYPIDTSRVIIIGMSQGGQTAIDAAINNIIPVKGFLACCPSKPGGLDKEAVKQAVQRGVRGTILAGERDRALLPDAKEINAFFKEMNLDHRFIVIPGMGHRVPANSTEHFQAAAAHILSPLGEGAGGSFYKKSPLPAGGID